MQRPRARRCAPFAAFACGSKRQVATPGDSADDDCLATGRPRTTVSLEELMEATGGAKNLEQPFREAGDNAIRRGAGSPEEVPYAAAPEAQHSGRLARALGLSQPVSPDVFSGLGLTSEICPSTPAGGHAKVEQDGSFDLSASSLPPDMLTPPPGTSSLGAGAAAATGRGPGAAAGSTPPESPQAVEEVTPPRRALAETHRRLDLAAELTPPPATARAAARAGAAPRLWEALEVPEEGRAPPEDCARPQVVEQPPPRGSRAPAAARRTASCQATSGGGGGRGGGLRAAAAAPEAADALGMPPAPAPEAAAGRRKDVLGQFFLRYDSSCSGHLDVDALEEFAKDFFKQSATPEVLRAVRSYEGGVDRKEFYAFFAVVAKVASEASDARRARRAARAACASAGG